MAFISCDGSVTQSASTAQCSGSWMVVPDQAIYREMPADDALELWGMAVLLLVIGFGIKLIRQTILNR